MLLLCRVDVEHTNAADDSQCEIEIQDHEGQKVAEATDCKAKIKLHTPKLWWPHMMHSQPGQYMNV